MRGKDKRNEVECKWVYVMAASKICIYLKLLSDIFNVFKKSITFKDIFLSIEINLRLRFFKIGIKRKCPMVVKPAVRKWSAKSAHFKIKAFLFLSIKDPISFC